MTDPLKRAKQKLALIDKSGASAEVKSQRVSTGFHRLGLVLANVVLIVGGYRSIVFVPDWSVPFSAPNWIIIPPKADRLDKTGTSSRPILKIEGIGNIPMPPAFDRLSRAQQKDWVDRAIRNIWRTKFALPLFLGLVITLVVASGIYGLVRAIGWVIGGFMAS